MGIAVRYLVIRSVSPDHIGKSWGGANFEIGHAVANIWAGRTCHRADEHSIQVKMCWIKTQKIGGGQVSFLYRSVGCGNSNTHTHANTHIRTPSTSICKKRNSILNRNGYETREKQSLKNMESNSRAELFCSLHSPVRPGVDTCSLREISQLCRFNEGSQHSSVYIWKSQEWSDKKSHCKSTWSLVLSTPQTKNTSHRSSLEFLWSVAP